MSLTDLIEDLQDLVAELKEQEDPEVVFEVNGEEKDCCEISFGREVEKVRCVIVKIQ